MYFFAVHAPTGRMGIGSTMQASGPYATAERALACRSRAGRGAGHQAVPSVIAICDPKLSATLGCRHAVHDQRCRKVLEALKSAKPPGEAKPVDMREVAAAACPAEIESLAELVHHHMIRRQWGHGYSYGQVRRWALQLLLDTSDPAGRALTSRQGWPMTWYSPTATTPGKSQGRGWQRHQIGLLTWRVEKGRWPPPEQRLASWWYERMGYPEVPARTEERMRLARAAGGGG